MKCNILKNEHWHNYQDQNFVSDAFIATIAIATTPIWAKCSRPFIQLTGRTFSNHSTRWMSLLSKLIKSLDNFIEMSGNAFAHWNRANRFFFVQPKIQMARIVDFNKVSRNVASFCFMAYSLIFCHIICIHCSCSFHPFIWIPLDFEKKKIS